MLYKLSKALFVLFLFYTGWFQDVFFQIPKMPLILGSGMIIVFLLHGLLVSRKATLIIPKPIFIWIIFLFYCLLAGLLIAYDKNHLVKSLLTYFQIIAMMVYIINVSAIEGENKFFLRVYLIYSIIYMCTMLIWGVERSGRLALSINSNPNGDGMTLLLGVFCVLFLMNTKKLNRVVLSLGLVALFAYTIILTGSRKSFMALIMLLVLWFILAFRGYWKSYSINKKILSLIIVGVIFYTAMYLVTPTYFESILFSRLTKGGYTIGSDIARSGMYREALNFFYDNPLLGIGFNHYRILGIYRTYSHSTYAEIISTTGLVGTVIYFSAYVVIIYNLFRIHIGARRTTTSEKSLQFLILMAVILALGMGVIHFYEIIDNLMFGIMISFYYTEELRLKRVSKVNYA